MGIERHSCYRSLLGAFCLCALDPNLRSRKHCRIAAMDQLTHAYARQKVERTHKVDTGRSTTLCVQKCLLSGEASWLNQVRSGARLPTPPLSVTRRQGVARWAQSTFSA